MLVLLGIGLSLLAMLGGGSVRFLQLREKLVTVIIGVVFLVSAAIGKPLMHELVRAFLARNNDPELTRVDSVRNESFFRAIMMTMTLVWGVGLLADAAVSVVLLYVLSISDLSRRESDPGLGDYRFSDFLERLVRQKEASRRRSENGSRSSAISAGGAHEWRLMALRAPPDRSTTRLRSGCSAR